MLPATIALRRGGAPCVRGRARGPVVADPETSVPEPFASRVLDSLPAAVVVLDRHGRVRSANPAACELFGEGLEGRSWRDVVAECVADGPAGGPDVRLRDGRRIGIATQSLHGEPGQVLLLTDVTAAREVEGRLHRLRRLSDTGQLLSVIAHQVRTPLASVLLDAANLRMALPRGEAPWRPVLDRLLGRLRHVEGLLGDLLAFARGRRLSIEPVDLAVVLDHLREGLQEQMGARGVALRSAHRPGQAVVKASPEALESALSNLVRNAAEAGARTVDVVVVEDGPAAVAIEIRDDGPGIPAAARARIFEPLFSTRNDGNGLGLSIARAIVEGHGGTLDLVSGGAAGTVFRVRLPRVGASAPESTAEAERQGLAAVAAEH